YQEKNYISTDSTHAIIIPDGNELHDNYDGEGEIGDVIPDWSNDPYRIIGYTFEGWNTESDGTGTTIDETTTITDDMLYYGTLCLYAKWSEYASPDITTGSLTISAKNAAYEQLSDVTIDDGQGNTGIQSDVTEYYAEVYSDTQYLTLEFEQYEPAAVTSVTFNDEVISTSTETITGTGYVYNSVDPVLEETTVETGVKYTTEENAISLNITSDDQVYNVIEITVTLPAGDDPVSTKTYTINIKRLGTQLSPNYGNTPYGRIMKDSMITDAKKEEYKQSFDDNYTITYSSGYYSPDAWNPYGDDGVEVVKGSTLSGYQYINYDKDDTAIVVYSGDNFTDPGVTLYSADGTTANLDASDVTRTVKYQTVDSLKYSDWGSAQDAEQGISGDDWTVDILEDNYVKPGVYTITYSYNADGKTVTTDRNMIVLPKVGDLNMDNYVNALDTLVYDSTISTSDVTGSLYTYRALDANNDGTLDSDDKTYFKSSRSEMEEFYPSYSIALDAVSSEYEVPEEANGDMAQLYMEYLGTGDSPSSEGQTQENELNESDVFWVGYHLDNVEKLGLSGVKALTLTVDYDARYIAPNADSLDALITTLKEQNSVITSVSIEGESAIAGTYASDASDAAVTWNGSASVKMLKIEMYADSLNLTDGYLFKIPFVVNVVPPSDDRLVITTQLGANTLNISDGTTGYMWDTSDSLNTVTSNLMSSLQYMGDFVPKFGAEAAATLLGTYAYGAEVTITKSVFSRGDLEGDLPDGLTYTKNLNQITGNPTELGTFDFYIGGNKYEIIVEKAVLTVTAENKTKTYGDTNPTLTYTYSGFVFDEDESVLTTKPTASCDAGTKADYLSETPITLSGGEDDNYSFEYESGTLTVDTQKSIDITAISNIPACTAQEAANNSFPYTILATAEASYFTATGILEDDDIKISYDVTYADNTEGNQTVSISNCEIVSDYGAGNNYTIGSCIDSSNDGVVEERSITSLILNTDNLDLQYTYGETLDLSGGKITVIYNSDTSETISFDDADSYGIAIIYESTERTAATGDKITVKDHNGSGLKVYCPDDDTVRSRTTGKLEITKKDLHLTADDKTKTYGEENPTLTYSFDSDDFVYDETSLSQSFTSGYTAPDISCAAEAGTDVGEVDIVLTGGSSDNYNIVCTNGTLTINKRSLKITAITSGVPALYSYHYTGEPAPYNVAASAYAGNLTDDNTVSMTVENLYGNDPVKVNYNAQYANSHATSSVSVTVADAAMDDDYGKSYNYTVDADSVTTAAGGVVYARNISSIEIVEQPTLEYTYGTPLDLDTGDIKVTYDSGEVYDLTVQQILDSYSDITVTYDGTVEVPQDETHLTVADSGKKIKFVSIPTYGDAVSAVTDEITVNPHALHVEVNDIYTIYGNTIPDYTYTASDFQYDETKDTASGFAAPTITCKEDDGETEVNQKTPAGVYTMRISGGSADNYSFVYTNGNLTIRQRPIIVTEINNIPSLSAQAAYEGELTIPQTVTAKSDSEDLVFSSAPLWNDEIRLTYDVVYPDSSTVGETEVSIANAALDRTYGDARNYYLQKIASPQTGEVIAAVITKIEITSDPTKTDGEATVYQYGDTLDLSGGFRITFDSGRVDEDVTFDELKAYGITAKYTDTDDEVKNNIFLTLAYDGKSITLSPPEDSTAESVTTAGLSVSKREMHVIVNDSTSVYGETPEYSLGYTEDDLAPGEVLTTAFGEFTAPTLSCTIDGNPADGTVDAGTYTNTITASGGESDNYEFVCDDKGTLTIEKRPLTIRKIADSNVPILTAEEAYKHNYTLPIELYGTADNDSITLENLVNSDSIEITYTAVYQSLEQSDNETVEIKDAAFAEDCENKDNYYIASAPSTATGSIQTLLMTSITVNSDPTKMEYTYGEWFTLAGGSVDIGYNSGYVEEGVTFDKLADFGIDITFVKDGTSGEEVIGEVKPNELLTVPIHNGAKIKLTPSDGTLVSDDIEPAYYGALTVKNHSMRVIADDASVTYGDGAPVYAWHYNSSDLVNGDSLTSTRFIDGLIDSTTVTCVDADGNAISQTTSAGEYDIVPTVGSCANYEFVAVNGTLTINKKGIEISAINSDVVPQLTSEIIYANGRKTPINITGAAEYTTVKQDMTVTGIINNDEIGITFDAVYNSITSAETVDVGIENVAFDGSHAKNSNYEITSYPLSASGGIIAEEQITSVTITKDPTLRDDNNLPIQYTYGDNLNLDRGAITVEYDNGKVLSGVKFSEIETETDGKIELVYDDGNDTPASDNEVLYASYHDGKAIKLKVTSEADVVEPSTEKLTVNKAEITVTAENLERYYGDKNPTLEFEYSGFVNGDNETSDGFTLELEKPVISCAAVAKSPVGEYDITLTGGSSANYSFKLVPAVLTVNKRPLDIMAITGGVPALTAKIMYEEPQLIHRLDGVAINTAGQMSLNNLSAGDTVKITYTAMYTSTTSAENVTVNISNIALDESYGESGNYELVNVPSTAYCGNIYEKQISMVEITSQPKLEYTYGELLDLSEDGVRITYNSGEVFSNVAYSDLASYGVDLVCTDANGTTLSASDVNKLTVDDYTGAYLTLIPQTTLSNISSPSTKTITVNKKAIDINISDVSSVYGEDPTAQFEFEYDAEDFVYGETESSAEFTDSLTEPEFVCIEKDGTTAVNSYTNVGTYTISMKNASSANYSFVYHNASLVISKRPLKIVNITDGIPALTSDIIYETDGTVYKIDAEAVNSQLELENLVNNDSVKIKYRAVYRSETPTSSCNVEVEYLSMDDDYGKSGNYEIDAVNSAASVGGGTVYDREITSVEILEQPKLEYVYGETLDLSGGLIRVTYDSGYTEETAFDSVTSRVSLTYTGTNDSASDGDVLNVPYHDGKTITLTASSTHSVETAVTQAISVDKLMLEYGDVTANPIVYDGVTTETDGVITFTNVQNGDITDVSAVFKFDDALAGEDKIVYITDITLNGNSALNYELPTTQLTASGTIEKAVFTPSISEENIEISSDTNTLTITAAELTDDQIAGGAKYEYTIDGGETWQESNVFENLEAGQTCKVGVRFAETYNYKQSDVETYLDVTAYKYKVTLSVKGEETTLISFYTNIASVQNEAELKELIGNAGVTYYQLYSDSAGKIKLTYPLTLRRIR
ncbi:MAG: YDG domain-containing protein, partial [Oscillospiraceae bacterium]|nr:YDG domain-containing protein [Oscillospiraceae bacterium]